MNAYPSLLLNADYMPLSRRPLSTLSMQETIKGVFLERFIVVEEYDRIIHSAGRTFEMRVPSVVALKSYQSQNHIAPFTRMGILLREKGKCAYCHTPLKRKDLTFDHIYPRSKGGDTSWQNVVASCQSCNSKKANKLLADSGLKLHVKPYAPTKMQLNSLAADFPPPIEHIHETWLSYLGMEKDMPTQKSGQTGAGIVFPNGMTSEQYWDAELDL